jgi:hypothetical protein
MAHTVIFKSSTIAIKWNLWLLIMARNPILDCKTGSGVLHD